MNLQEVWQNNEYDDTEEHIENIYPMQPTICFARIDCRVVNKNGQCRYLSTMLCNNEKVETGCTLDFFIESTNISRPYEVFWKVKNEGITAQKNNCIRGQIFRAEDGEKNHETSDFAGNHYVECYIIKNKVCIAKAHIDVPIR